MVSKVDIKTQITKDIFLYLMEIRNLKICRLSSQNGIYQQGLKKINLYIVVLQKRKDSYRDGLGLRAEIGRRPG